MGYWDILSYLKEYKESFHGNKKGGLDSVPEVARQTQVNA